MGGGAVRCLPSLDVFGRDQAEKMFVVSGSGGTLSSGEEQPERRMTGSSMESDLRRTIWQLWR